MSWNDLTPEQIAKIDNIFGSLTAHESRRYRDDIRQTAWVLLLRKLHGDSGVTKFRGNKLTTLAFSIIRGAARNYYRLERKAGFTFRGTRNKNRKAANTIDCKHQPANFIKAGYRLGGQQWKCKRCGVVVREPVEYNPHKFGERISLDALEFDAETELGTE